MIFKENGKVNLSGWSVRWKYICEGTMEEGLRRKAQGCALIVHLPMTSARDAIRYILHDPVVSKRQFLVQKIDTLFKVIDQIFFLNTLKCKLPRRPVPGQTCGFRVVASRNSSQKRGDRRRSKKAMMKKIVPSFEADISEQGGTGQL